jgi:hypothetical protein
MAKPQFYKKPFPARVRWKALWLHRWAVLNLINQMAHEPAQVTVETVKRFGGSTEFGKHLHQVARDIISVER